MRETADFSVPGDGNGGDGNDAYSNGGVGGAAAHAGAGPRGWVRSDHHAVWSAGGTGRPALYRRAARPDAGADRTLSGCAADADPDGVDLSDPGRRGRALAAGSWQCRLPGRRAGGSASTAALGPEREVAGSVPANPEAAQRPA